MLHRFAVILTAALLLAPQAYALSCVQPDIYRAFEEYKERDELYIVVKGQFVELFDQQSITTMDNVVSHYNKKTPRIKRAYMVFEGTQISHNKAYDKPLERYLVEIKTTCMGVWCSGTPPQNTELITFIEKREDALPRLTTSPCPGNVFSDAESIKTTKKLRRCFHQTCYKGR